jgi:hypothetical protein
VGLRLNEAHIQFQNLPASHRIQKVISTDGSVQFPRATGNDDPGCSPYARRAPACRNRNCIRIGRRGRWGAPTAIREGACDTGTANGGLFCIAKHEYMTESVEYWSD